MTKIVSNNKPLNIKIKRTRLKNSDLTDLRLLFGELMLSCPQSVNHEKVTNSIVAGTNSDADISNLPFAPLITASEWNNTIAPVTIDSNTGYNVQLITLGNDLIYPKLNNWNDGGLSSGMFLVPIPLNSSLLSSVSISGMTAQTSPIVYFNDDRNSEDKLYSYSLIELITSGNGILTFKFKKIPPSSFKIGIIGG